jgi:polyisoprenyl-phosphate glycosyltransferase
MKKLLDTFVTVVVIADAHSEDMASRVQQITDLTKENYANYEVLAVDNGLSLEELNGVKSLLQKVACIRIIRLAKSDDIDTAIFAGVEAAIGDYICILYNNDPIELIPQFVEKNHEADIVFGIAQNLYRKTWFERKGTQLFYWYNRKYLHINIPSGSTYYMCLNRNAANALTRNNRAVRHIRHLANMVGFNSTSLEYSLPQNTVYSHAKRRELILRALDLVSGYSNHPLRALSYFGVVAALLNLAYAGYVVAVNLSKTEVVEGWTTLSLQSSVMFFFLFMVIAVLAEYVGKILVEARSEPPYHIMQELGSTVSLADETRRNVTK